MKLEQLLPDEKSKKVNRRALWLTLATLPTSQLITLSEETADSSILEGWLQLAILARKKNSDPTNLVAELNEWQAIIRNIQAALFFLHLWIK